ncbi:M16 family metallopeptidase [Mariniblastus fucicola]|uniref:Protease 3 n=1 Tax=Mariniblastus fucicola TaxID=980251 RepID=A0A5B9P2K1_9BACT|nr:pitrilysin family protein [Mariniblastus fucicola]QEG20747.1 Protease 3 precursor [Mariniblastus fucicola]
MEYRQHQLDNGLTVLAECNPQAHFSAFGFFVRTGARDETAEIGGVSHFLEHMVFKGTPNRSADQVNLELDEMGSSSNARTGEESTIYHAAVLPEFQTPMVNLLSDIMRPSLREEDFETEKQVIIEEILMYADQPPYGGYEKIMEEFFAGHPLQQSVLGTVETVGDLSAEQMKRYFDQQYSPGNIAFAASGKVDFDRLVEDIEQNCGDWKPFDVSRDLTEAKVSSGVHTIHRENSAQQYILQMARGPASNDPRRFASRVAMSIFGDDAGSRLYWEFLDSGRAESIGVGPCEYLGSGAVMTFLCCSPDAAKDNFERLTKLQKEIQAGANERELEMAKRKIASQIVLGSEATEARMFSIGTQWLNGADYKTPEEIATLYESVTLDEVNEVLVEFPLDVNTTVSIGPNESL